jgi:hypothetical protein
LENAGNRLIRENNLTDGIKILEASASSSETKTSNFSLANAYFLRFRTDNRASEDKARAIKAFEKVLNDGAAASEVKTVATERLTVLKGPL